MLEGAHGQGMAGCPIDQEVQKIVGQRARAFAVWDPQARLRARWGPGAKPLVGVQVAKPLEAPVFFNAETAIFNGNLHT